MPLRSGVAVSVSFFSLSDTQERPLWRAFERHGTLECPGDASLCGEGSLNYAIKIRVVSVSFFSLSDTQERPLWRAFRARPGYTRVR